MFQKIINMMTTCYNPSRNQTKTKTPSGEIEENKSVFTEYSPAKEVGRGTYGTVWMCDKKWSNKRVAVKFSTDAQLSLFYLYREYKILSSFDCDCIIKPIHLYHTSKCAQMVLPYYKQDLLTYMEGCPRLSDADLKIIIKRMAIALNYTHSKDIVHRDIKPENIMFNNTMDDCVLIDWGFAKHEDNINVTKLTGTMSYMAPELILALIKPERYLLVVGKMADMYSLGATLYVITARKQTIDIKSKKELIKITTNDMTHKIELLDRDEGFKDILQKLLYLDPVSRMTAEELLKHPYIN